MSGNVWQIDRKHWCFGSSKQRTAIVVLLLCLKLWTSLFMIHHMSHVIHVHSSISGQLIHLQNTDALPMSGIHSQSQDQHEDHDRLAAENALNQASFILPMTAEGLIKQAPPLDNVLAKKLEIVYLAHRLHRLAPKQSPPATA